MRSHHDPCTGIECEPHPRQGRTNTCIVGNVAGIVLRHIEVGPNEDPFSGQLFGGEVSEFLELHSDHRFPGSKFEQLQSDEKGNSTHSQLTAPSRRRHFRYYLAVIKATVVSSIRFEKPHSLSYQLPTLTSLPETLVSDSSKVLDAGL